MQTMFVKDGPKMPPFGWIENTENEKKGEKSMKRKGQKMQQIRTIEHHLRNYNTYKVGIKNLRMELDYIMPNISANYEMVGGSSGTFSIHSATEKYAIDRIESKRALDLHESIRQYELIIKSIDLAVAQLSVLEKKFVELRYFQGKSINEVTEQIGYSTPKSVFNLRNQVFDKLLISLKVIASL